MVTASVLMIYPIIYHRRQERAHGDVKHTTVSEVTVQTTAEPYPETKVPLIYGTKEPEYSKSP